MIYTLESFAFQHIIGPILQLIDTIFIYLNTLIYDFISFLYQIIIALSSAQIFNNGEYQKIANNVYVVIGVVSLFLIAYALLRAIINPENASKGENAVGKIVPNVLKVIIFIAFVPTVFNIAYKLQEVIITTNIIPKVIFGKDFQENELNEDNEFSYKETGRNLANIIFTSFLYPKDGVDAQDIEINECNFPAPTCDGIENTSAFGNILKHLSLLGKVSSKVESLTGNWQLGIVHGFIANLIGKNRDKLNSDDRAYTFADAVIETSYGDKNFQVYANFGSKIHGDEKQLEYNGILQLIAGIIVIYIFMNYCIDLGVRAIKLGYYQLIAPIPILSSLIPGQKKIFDNWLKAVISTYLDVFFRIVLLFFVIFVLNMLPAMDSTLWANSSFAENVAIQNFARVFLIIGLLIFMKEAPKLLSDLFGVSPIKFGIKDKLGEMAGIGGAAKDALSNVPSVSGALTGAAGGAWTAAWNKGKVWDAAKLGALNGAKKGGNQFNKQRSYIWEDVYGMRGPAGLFGGRPLYNKAVDELKNTVNDKFLQYDEAKGMGTNSRVIKEMESAKAFTNIYDKHLNDLKSALNNLANAESLYTGNIKNLQGTISNLNSDLTNSKNQYEKYNNDYNGKIKDIEQIYANTLKQEREIAAQNGDTAKVLAYGQKIQEVQNGMATQDAINYIKNNDISKYNDLQSTIASRQLAKNNMDTINNNLERYNAQLTNEINAMNADHNILNARKALESFELKDENGNKINITASSQVSQEDIEKYARDKARAQYRKENDEYAWRVAAEEKEKREVDIKKAKTSAENEALKDIFEGAFKKYSNNDKK